MLWVHKAPDSIPGTILSTEHCQVTLNNTGCGLQNQNIMRQGKGWRDSTVDTAIISPAADLGLIYSTTYGPLLSPRNNSWSQGQEELMFTTSCDPATKHQIKEWIKQGYMTCTCKALSSTNSFMFLLLTPQGLSLKTPEHAEVALVVSKHLWAWAILHCWSQY